MTIALDPKFAKVVALTRSTSHAGERDAARKRAEAMAAAAGMSFDEALAYAEAPAPASPSIVEIFAGFDDWQEEREPGYKARCAAEKAERERQRLLRRATILKGHGGSEDAALAPCERERRLHQALAKWRQPCEPPHERWTYEIREYETFCPERMPAEMRAAIEKALPLPTTLREALAEHAYWTARCQDFEDILGPGNYGDSGLDLTAEIRRELLLPLVEHVLPAETLADLRDRLRYFRDLDVIDKAEILEALVRDADRLAASHPSSVSSDLRASHPSSADDRDGQIRAALDADPSRSDRDIARACRCSPTTVGKVRRQMGLGGTTRSVHRSGQMYQMKFSFEGRP